MSSVGINFERAGFDSAEVLDRLMRGQRVRDKNILVALGNDFTGFDPEGKVMRISDVLPWLQRAIHERYAMSKYDVERLGGTFTPQMAEIP